MLTKTIHQGGVSATVHTETGKHFILKRHLYARVVIEGIEWDLWFNFIRALVQSDNVTVPFEWPADYADIDALKVARDAWYELPGDVVRAWLDACEYVDTAPGDVDLAPNISQKKEQTPQSSENETSSAA